MCNSDPSLVLSKVAREASIDKSVKRKPFEDMLDRIIKRRTKTFQNIEIVQNTIRCEIKPSTEITVSINVWNAKELWVRIIFNSTMEVVEIEDTSFGKHPVEWKVQRLENLIVNLQRLRKRKEELFAGLQNWDDFKKCNRMNFTVPIYTVQILNDFFCIH